MMKKLLLLSLLWFVCFAPGCGGGDAAQDSLDAAEPDGGEQTRLGATVEGGVPGATSDNIEFPSLRGERGEFGQPVQEVDAEEGGTQPDGSPESPDTGGRSVIASMPC